MNSPEGRIPLVHTRRPRHLRAFLTHCGMVKADRTKNALYMRGTDPAHHIHVTGLLAADEATLAADQRKVRGQFQQCLGTAKVQTR